MIKYIPKIIFLLFIFYLGFLLGNSDLMKSKYPGYDSIVNKENEKIVNQEEVDFSIFWDAWKTVEDQYTIEQLDYQKMVYGAISGMVDSLDDPYTVFLTPEENTRLKVEERKK